jgi:hypothetical protein
LDAAAAIFHKKIFAGKTGLPGIPIISLEGIREN